MRFEIIIPSAGDSIDSCQLAKWHLEDSARVKRGEVILTVETDKVSCDIEAEFSGILSHKVKEGSTAKIGGLVGYIEHDGSEIDDVIRDLRQNQQPEGADSSGSGFLAAVLKLIQYILMFLGLKYLVELILR